MRKNKGNLVTVKKALLHKDTEVIIKIYSENIFGKNFLICIMIFKFSLKVPIPLMVFKVTEIKHKTENTSIVINRS